MCCFVGRPYIVYGLDREEFIFEISFRGGSKSRSMGYIQTETLYLDHSGLGRDKSIAHVLVNSDYVCNALRNVHGQMTEWSQWYIRNKTALGHLLQT